MKNCFKDLSICFVLNCCFYQKPLKNVSQSNYSESVFNNFQNTSGRSYICMTCDIDVKKNLATYKFSSLNKPEILLISKKLLFQKISVMPKRQMPKLDGAICSMLISIIDTATNFH